MKINENIIAKELQGDTVLLNMKNGDYFTLNNMGTEIYNHLCNGTEVDEIADLLFDKYDVEYEKLKEDIFSLIDELKKKDILFE